MMTQRWRCYPSKEMFIRLSRITMQRKYVNRYDSQTPPPNRTLRCSDLNISVQELVDDRGSDGQKVWYRSSISLSHKLNSFLAFPACTTHTSCQHRCKLEFSCKSNIFVSLNSVTDSEQKKICFSTEFFTGCREHVVDAENRVLRVQCLLPLLNQSMPQH